MDRLWRYLIRRESRPQLTVEPPDPDLEWVQTRQDDLERRVKALGVQFDVRRRDE